jgi:hypothetical protein
MKSFTEKQKTTTAVENGKGMFIDNIAEVHVQLLPSHPPQKT